MEEPRVQWLSSLPFVKEFVGRPIPKTLVWTEAAYVCVCVCVCFLRLPFLAWFYGKQQAKPNMLGVQIPILVKPAPSWDIVCHFLFGRSVKSVGCRQPRL